MNRIAFVCLLITLPLSAAIFHPMDTTTPLLCSFSANHHNRILIENSRIKKVIFPEEKLFIRLEETSGQLFVQAKTPTQERIVISIVSQDGIIQDLEIDFSDLPSQVVVLREQEKQQSIRAVNCYPCSSDGSYQSIVESILQREIPRGFLSAPITSSTRKIKAGVQAKLVAHLQGAYEDLFIYQIINTGSWKRRLLERDLICNDPLWVYIEKDCLEPKETALSIVAVSS